MLSEAECPIVLRGGEMCAHLVPETKGQPTAAESKYAPWATV